MPELPTNGVAAPAVSPTPAPAVGQPAAPAPAQSAAPAKPADSGQKYVPISAMLEERHSRQAAEAKFSELQKEVESLKQLASQYQQPAQPQFQQPFGFQPQGYQQPSYNPAYQQAPPNIKEQIDNLWQEDIRKGFQAEMMAMMQYQNQVVAKVDQEADMLRSKAPDFGNYESKVRSYIRTLPLDAQAQPNIVQAAYLMMRGQDTDNLLKQRESEWAKKYGVQAGMAATGMTGTFGAPSATDNVTLTQDELIAAQSLRMSPEEYIKWRA